MEFARSATLVAKQVFGVKTFHTTELHNKYVGDQSGETKSIVFQSRVAVRQILDWVKGSEFDRLLYGANAEMRVGRVSAPQQHVRRWSQRISASE